MDMIIRLKPILDRFPEHKEKILKLIEENEDFKCICLDYAQCLMMFESFVPDAGETDAIVEGYLEIKIGLEEEVLRFIYQ